jgi:hypothetical protein
MTKRRLPIDGAQLSQLVAILLAVVVAFLANAVVARHYTRWDLTSNKRYTLSRATIQTLHDLPETVQIWVLLGSSDPLEQSVKQLLVSYRAETSKLDVHFVDPDRDVVALEDLRKRFKIEASRTEGGRVVTDAIVVVARGDRHWFLLPSDMVQPAAGQEGKVQPREEQALTGAIRNVLAGEKAKLCFTTGHGEMSPFDPSEHGAGELKEILDKDNYESAVVDPGQPNVPEPFKGCSVAVIAGMRGGFTKEETERLRTWLLAGGDLLLAASPISGDTPTGLAPAGLERALAPFGIGLDEDVVLETDPDLVIPGTSNSRYVVVPKQHAITTGLVKADATTEVPRTIVQFTRSLKHVSEASAPSASELLVTSPQAIGYTNVNGAADWKGPPPKRAGDLGGPLVVAMASERPKVSPSAPHGPRVVVIGTASPLTSPMYREPLPVRGAAIFTLSAISWLASKPQVLDVPEKAAVAAGLHMTDESRSELRRYVVLFMPGAFALAGIAIALARRSGEGAPRKGKGKATGKGEDDEKNDDEKSDAPSDDKERLAK